MPDLICPRCMEKQTISITLDGCDTLTCKGCNEDYNVPDVEALIESWTAVLPWLRAAIRSHPSVNQPAPPRAAEPNHEPRSLQCPRCLPCTPG